uniref:DNA replication ATP-dependent helicase/nuclease n=1 Tax=Parastrongyloides trichosuri TaxID=131310 RepID=A0A0N4ZNV0_PARTI
MKRCFEGFSKGTQSDSGYSSVESLPKLEPLYRIPKIEKDIKRMKTDDKNEKENINNQVIVDQESFTMSVINVGTIKDGMKIVQGLILENGKDERKIILQLRDDWKDTLLEEGQEVFVLKSTEINDNTFIVENKKGFIIVEPYQLIAPTTVASFHSCERKSVLKERCSTSTEVTLPLLIGNSVHELFQFAINNINAKTTTNDKYLLAIFRSRVIPKFITEMAVLNLKPENLVDEVKVHVLNMQNWLRKFMPKPYGEHNVYNRDENLFIDSVVDIEENIWLPEIGLKGKIDVTLKLKDKFGKYKYGALELKTGKSISSQDHITQASLYSVMLSVLDDQEIVPSQLLYLKDEKKLFVKPNDYIVGSMLRMRNEIVGFLKICEDPILPGIQSEPNICSYCSHNTFCALELVLEKRKNKEINQKDTEKFLEEKVAHLLPEDIEYFANWRRMLFLEWTEACKLNSPGVLFKTTPQYRFENDTCLPSLLLIKKEAGKESTCNLILTFSIDSLDPDFKKKWLVGEFIYISSDDRVNICSGFIKSNESSLIIETMTPMSRYLKVEERYHLDMMESSRFFQQNMMSVVKLMENEDKCKHLRNIIINGEYPLCGHISPTQLLVINNFIKNLSEPQRDAVIHSIKETGFSLIKGMPGAGKTTVIAALVRCLIRLGKTVLIACYTNSAVDNCLEKIGKYVRDELILRVGSDSRAQEWSMKYCLSEKIKNIRTNDGKVDMIRKILTTTKLVAGTCVAMQSSMILDIHSQFDVCIIDEASLCLECNVILPLLKSKSFVLVGDDKQLKPLVKCEAASEMGMNISLFEKLFNKGKGISIINTQFRMNKVICRVPSKLFYEGKMKCANSKVENAVIECKNFDSSLLTKKDIYLPENVCQKVLSKNIEDSLIFLDVMGIEEKLESSKIKETIIRKTTNLLEAKHVMSCLRLLIEHGVDPSDIGVITPFRDQMNMMRSVLHELSYKNLNGPLYNNVEISTVDQFQGRDKNVMIFSTVFNFTEEAQNCELLNNPRRINVALTRAKHKLIIIGCSESLKKLEIPCKVVNLIANNIVRLRHNTINVL